MMSGFVNAFPPLGESRIWSESYIRYVAKEVPELKWERYGKLKQIHLQTTPKCSGLYMFVWNNSQVRLTPFKGYFPLIVYVGKSENLQNRIKSYIDDNIAINNYRASERPIRDAIKVMLKEYGQDIELYYAMIDPTKITHYEDVLIKIFDPIFNTSQKLKEENFEAFSKIITAELEAKQEGLAAPIEQKKMLNKNEDNRLQSSFGQPEAAF